MAKRKIIQSSTNFRGLLSDSLALLEAFLGKAGQRLPEKMMKKYATAAVIAVAALATVFNGISLLLESIFPALRNGISYIIIGLLSILAAVYLKER